MESSRMGRDRVIVCYRDALLDPVRRDHPNLVTVRWRDNPSPNPESLLTGSLYSDLRAVGEFTVTDPPFFAFNGTRTFLRQSFPGLVGGEVDRVLPGYPVPKGLHVFAHSPAAGSHDAHGWADATAYLASSGAGVLNLASMNWLPAQAPAPHPGRVPPLRPPRHSEHHPRSLRRTPRQPDRSLTAATNLLRRVLLR
jgi:hypothetical protein